MTKVKTSKKHSLHPILWILLVIFTILFISAILFLFRLRREINNTEVLRSYRISCDESTEAEAEFLRQLCRSRLSSKLYSATSASHLYLHLADTEAAAEDFGFSLAGIKAKGFLIARQGNGLYLLASDGTGLSRACYYLVHRLTSADGTLLLAQDERYLDTGDNLRDVTGPKGTPLSEYNITYAKGLNENYAYDLGYYLNLACGVLPEFEEADLSSGIPDTSGTKPRIALSVEPIYSGAPYAITFSGSDIRINGSDEKGLADGILEFANTCLGWMYAGTPGEKLSGSHSPIHLPDTYGPGEEIWIPEREAIITLWNTNYSRGAYLNDSTSTKTDIMSFSDEQLYEYIRMLKFCGFTGIQVTDMCSAWAGAGGYEYVHERLRIMANAAHSLGMNFTLWVWGAEFTGYGWVDNSVTYSSEGYNYAHENPDVLATFEKYYSIYAELADCCDRVIAHYYDPGNLKISEDVAYFANLLSEKFRAINPEIDFGVNCWVDAFDKKAIIAALGNDITFYENGHHEVEGDYQGFRTFCKNSGCRLGTWAWNTCEMEIDQLAQMNFNPHIIQEVYLTSAKYDGILKPSYWSEMDSNHVINVFSLYCAGQLLIDPARDPDELTEEVAYAAVGSEYCEEFADVLRLIEDARSGKTWNTYWWSSEDYIVKSDAYPAEEILRRSEKALLVLNEMIEQNISANTLPLPLELREVLHLMLPQIEQIRDFARFRIGFSEVKEMLARGAAAESIQEKLQTISTPISEFNTVTGLWGQIEARAQQEMLFDFCSENGFEMPINATFRQTAKNRIYYYFASCQKGHSEPVLQYPPYFQYGIAYGPETTTELVKELTEEGLFSVDETTGGIYLTDWEHYKYAFN
ncbi:MAG: hypothetical protein ACI4HQ_08445 [Acetatifactor sp.]